MTATTSETIEPTFEEAYGRLEELIGRLEEGGLSLEDALGCYEEASALVRRCEAVLDAAELRLRNVAEGDGTGEGDEGEAPF